MMCVTARSGAAPVCQAEVRQVCKERNRKTLERQCDSYSPCARWYGRAPSKDGSEEWWMLRQWCACRLQKSALRICMCQPQTDSSLTLDIRQNAGYHH